MTGRVRIVLDTNVLISRLLRPQSVPGSAVAQAVGMGQLLASEAMISELATVLARPKFDAYLSVGERQEFIRLVGSVSENVRIVYRVHACRDPKDNIILETAVNGLADLIVTGDADLLALRAFHGVRIVTPAEYLRGSWQGAS